MAVPTKVGCQVTAAIHRPLLFGRELLWEGQQVVVMLAAARVGKLVLTTSGLVTQGRVAQGLVLPDRSILRVFQAMAAAAAAAKVPGPRAQTA